MRNLMVCVTVLLFTAICCRKDPDSISNVPHISIKGGISVNNQKSSLFKSANELTLSDAKKVLIFNSTGYKLFDIENGTFNGYAISGTATAIAFLDAGNKYIGCLTAGGLNVLPLVSLKDGDNTIIDLGNLSLDGTSVIPLNNPIGNEIDLSEEEVARYRELGAYYESLSKNIDADNDGEPDVLSRKEFNISTIFDMDCGTWGLNDVSPGVNDTSLFFINYRIRIAGGESLIPDNTNIVFAGPEGSPYDDITQERYSPAPDGFITAFIRRAVISPENPSQYRYLPFREGRYTIILDAEDYSLNYSNINAKYFFILALPTIHTNENNEIVSVSVTYTDMDNTPVTAENFVYQTQVSLGGNQGAIYEMGALWENPEAKTNTELYNFTLPDPVPLSDLQAISVMYVDLIGNSYQMRFRQ